MQGLRLPGLAPLLQKLRAMVGRRSTGDHETDYQALSESAGDLGAEYHRLVTQQLRRWGVHESCAGVEIQQLGARKGKQVFVATICLTAWDRNAALRVLLGLPILDQKVRKVVEDLWLADVSAFEGVVLRVSRSLHESAPSGELRQLIVSLTGPRETYARQKGKAVTVAL